jgi:threonine/homoserine/homoserine lactone efflux protein
MASALRALLFGASLAIAVGPIALLILALGATSGFAAGARAGAGAAAADFLYALAAFSGGAALARYGESLSRLLALPGALLLLALGLWLALAALRAGKVEASPVPGPIARRPFTGVLLLTLANPLTVLLFVGFAPQLPLAASPARAFLYAACCGLGSLALQLLWALGGGSLRAMLGKAEHRRRLSLASGLLIAAFALAGLVHALTGGTG